MESIAYGMMYLYGKRYQVSIPVFEILAISEDGKQIGPIGKYV